MVQINEPGFEGQPIVSEGNIEIEDINCYIRGIVVLVLEGRPQQVCVVEDQFGNMYSTPQKMKIFDRTPGGPAGPISTHMNGA